MNKQDLRNKKVLELAEKIDKLRYGEISEIAKTLSTSIHLVLRVLMNNGYFIKKE